MPSPMVGSRVPSPDTGAREAATAARLGNHLPWPTIPVIVTPLDLGYYLAFHSRGRRTHARTVISAHKLDSPATDSEPTFPCGPARLG
jgi:hypothetical protein